MKQILLGFAVLLVCGFSHAGLITYNDYTLDEDTNIVTGGGLEWLQWDVTLDMSINQALADIADGVINGVDYGTGWQLATNVQMASLLNAFSIGGSTFWDADENTGQVETNYDGASVEDIDTDPELQLVEIFGRTEDRNTSDIRDLDITGAMFGNDLDDDGLYNSVTVFDDYNVPYYSSLINYKGYTYFNRDNYDTDYLRSGNGSIGIGVAFVRVVGATVEVAEPSAIALMALGLFGLVIRRKNII